MADERIADVLSGAQGTMFRPRPDACLGDNAGHLEGRQRRRRPRAGDDRVAQRQGSGGDLRPSSVNGKCVWCDGGAVPRSGGRINLPLMAGPDVAPRQIRGSPQVTLVAASRNSERPVGEWFDLAGASPWLALLAGEAVPPASGALESIRSAGPRRMWPRLPGFGRRPALQGAPRRS